MRLDLSGPLSRKNISIFHSSSLKVVPISPNASYVGAGVPQCSEGADLLRRRALQLPEQHPAVRRRRRGGARRLQEPPLLASDQTKPTLVMAMVGEADAWAAHTDNRVLAQPCAVAGFELGQPCSRPSPGQKVKFTGLTQNSQVDPAV
jgi:hypothetical protein